MTETQISAMFFMMGMIWGALFYISILLGDIKRLLKK